MNCKFPGEIVLDNVPIGFRNGCFKVVVCAVGVKVTLGVELIRCGFMYNVANYNHIHK